MFSHYIKIFLIVCVNEYRFLKRPEASEPSGAQITDGCELYDVCAGNQIKSFAKAVHDLNY